MSVMLKTGSLLESGMKLLVLSEEEPAELDGRLSNTRLDSEELEEVSVVLKISSLLDSEMKLEENVEL